MANDYSSDGMVRIDYVASIANKAAPTTTELNAGTSLTNGNFVVKDGLTVPNSQNTVPTSSLSETFDSEVPGSFGGPVQLKLKRRNGADTAWNLFTYGLAGFIVVRRGIASATAWTTSQAVEVYPGTSNEPVMDQTATNTLVTFMVSWPCSSQPALKAVVA